ncbi:MAG TPA: hypothetical protein VI138_09090, partial [Candidatus Dormibacteraeota bacterium]
MYDSATDQVVLFGGTPGCNDYNSDQCSYDDDTWIYDVSTQIWTEKHPAASPPFTGGGAIAYDPKLNQILLYGGNQNLSGIGSQEIGYWTYEPSTDTWTQLATDGITDPGTGNPIEDDVQLAWDPNSQHLVMFGGCWNWEEAGGSGNCWGPTSGATFTWNGGTSWAEVESPQAGGVYAAQALTAAGIEPGGTVTAGGMTFDWPAASAGTDGVVESPVNSQGVTIPTPNATPDASTLGILGSALNGPTHGTATLTYTDHTTAHV